MVGMVGAQFYIKEFKNDAAVFFEQIGYMAEITGEVRFKTTLNNETFQSEDELIRTMEEDLLQLCNQTMGRCANMIKRFNQHKVEIKLLREALQSSKNRKKRNNLFYDTLHYLFGLDNDAYDRIDDLGDNQAKIDQILKENKRHMIQIEQTRSNQTKELVNKYKHNFQAINGEISNMRKFEDILATYQVASDIMTEILETYRKIIQPQGGFHIWNETSHKLSLESKKSRSWTENELDVNEDHFLYEKEMYKLYKLHFLPQLRDNKCWKIKHYASFIAFKEDKYVLMTEEDWKACSEEEENLFICHLTEHRNVNEHRSCLLKYFRQTSNISNCQATTCHAEKLILKATVAPNSWIYTTASPENAEITCGSNKTEINLNNTGLIHISGSCILKTKYQWLKGMTRIASKIKKAHIAYGEIQQKGKTEIEYPTIHHSQQYPEEDGDIKLKIHTKHLEKQNWQIAGGLSVGGLGSGIILFLIFYLCCIRPRLNIFNLANR